MFSMIALMYFDWKERELVTPGRVLAPQPFSSPADQLMPQIWLVMNNPEEEVDDKACWHRNAQSNMIELQKLDNTEIMSFNFTKFRFRIFLLSQD